MDSRKKVEEAKGSKLSPKQLAIRKSVLKALRDFKAKTPHSSRESLVLRV